MSLAADLRTLRYLRPEQIVQRLWSRARRPWFASPIYSRLYLPAAAASAAPTRAAPSLTPGEADNGRRIIAGRIRLLEHERSLTVPADWTAADESPLWRFTLHYFDWLADLAAAGEERWVDTARLLVADWIVRHPRPGGVAWHPYPLSLRLHAWLHHAPALLAHAPAAFRRAFVVALHRQARHLSRAVEWDVGGNHLIKNLKALIAAGACLPGHEMAGHRALQDLETAVARQVLRDGTHEERSPAYHLQVLADLIDVAELLGDETPAWLTGAIRRMEAALATLKLGDGKLALFNDGTVGDARLLAAVGTRADAVAAVPDGLPDAGYHRLAAAGTVALFDAGRCCPDDLPAHAHADMLSFEMSVGTQRLIVNAGTFAYQEPAWRNRLRGTASHSTLVFNGEDSAEVHGVFRLGRRPRDVGARREGLSVEGWHDGYRHRGWRHRRRLMLRADGGRLDGEDVLEPMGRGTPGPVAIRFHLHPAVTAVEEGNGLRLTTPAGTWQFIAEGPVVLEPGVHAPHFNVMTGSRQIVLHRTTDARGLRIAWRLERAGDDAPPPTL